MLFHKVHLLAAIASLCEANVIHLPPRDKSEVVPKSIPSAKELSQETHFAKREDKSTEEGAIDGTSTDSLYTYGLATCVGLGATGDPANADGINKVLAHVTCANAIANLQDWTDRMNNAAMSNLFIGVSVVDPALIDEGVRNGQKELNRANLVEATTFVPGELWRVQPIVRSSTDGSTPLGTMKIETDRSMFAEGKRVLWPKPPTLDVDCFWPILYTPTDAPQSTKDQMSQLAEQICIDADGCNSGTPHCVTSNAKPNGYCVCV